MAASVALIETDAEMGERRSLAVHELGYMLRDKRLLQSVSCEWLGGGSHAILGPSGAGKTTLLRTLGGDVAGRVSGQIVYAGRELFRPDCQQLAAFIPQDDVLQPSLSPAELLRFTALLRGLAPSHIGEVIDSMRLGSCADTLVGDATHRGISGGERKRCSIAVELLSDPAVLLADEPSTGLDSAMAEDVIKLLAKTAQQGNRCIIATIHQPSWSLLGHFHSVTLLANGKVAYTGTADEMCKYFAGQGHKPPQFENPADFFMRLLQELPQRETLLATWEQQAHFIAASGSIGTQSGDTLQDSLRRKRSFPVSPLVQFRVLLHRNLVEFCKDRSRLITTFMLKFMVGLVIGAVWWRSAASPSNTSIFTTESALYCCIFASLIDTLAATLLFVPGVKAILHREVMNGLYCFSAWYWSTMATFFVQQGLASASLALPVYLMAGLRPGFWHFFMFFLDIAALACIGATMGLFVGGFTKDYQAARQAIMPVLVPQIIFSGYVIPYEKLHVWGKWLYHVALFQYGLSIARINQWNGVAFSDCPDLVAKAGYCFRTGEAYLEHSKLSGDKLLPDFLILLLLLTAFSVGSFFVMRRVATKPSN